MPRAISPPRPQPAQARALVVAAIAILGTRSACAPGPGSDADERCPVLPGEVDDRDTPWIFALCGDVDPAHVRNPRNDAEEAVFRYIYEGLTDVDCRGELVGRLAESWRSTQGGQVWTFELGRGRTFDDGTPVTPLEVLRSWPRDLRDGGSDPGQGFAIRRAETHGDALTVELRDPDPDFPFRVARPDFFVLRDGSSNLPMGTRRITAGAPTGATGPWPVGTRGRVVRTRDVTGGRELSFAAPDASTDVATAPVVFRVLPDTDPRDAFADDVEALLTRDRRALRYLAAQPEIRLTPLPWTRRYVLADARGAFPWMPAELTALRGELVRDVLLSVARAPWDPEPVTASRPAAGSSAGALVVRYLRDDPDGAALAERVASLATRHAPGKRWIVVPVSPASAHGGEAPAILPLPRYSFDPPSGRRHAATPRVGTFYPLADTRALLVTRGGVAGVQFGWDGTPRLDQAGRTRKRNR